jgi:hypothetical protein
LVGRVLDHGGGAIGGVMVYAHPTEMGRDALALTLPALVHTDSEGRFLISDVPVGLQRVVASVAQQVRASVEATVRAGETTEVELRFAR